MTTIPKLIPTHGVPPPAMTVIPLIPIHGFPPLAMTAIPKLIPIHGFPPLAMTAIPKLIPTCSFPPPAMTAIPPIPTCGFLSPASPKLIILAAHPLISLKSFLFISSHHLLDHWTQGCGFPVYAILKWFLTVASQYMLSWNDSWLWLPSICYPEMILDCGFPVYAILKWFLTVASQYMLSWNDS